jgi:uncharacterized protein YodC (DUF2158 family)
MSKKSPPPDEAPPFEPPQIVRLKSGSPDLTVVDCYWNGKQWMVDYIWFKDGGDGETQEGTNPAASLVASPDPE